MAHSLNCRRSRFSHVLLLAALASLAGARERAPTPQPAGSQTAPPKHENYTENYAGLNLEMVRIPGGTFQMGSRLSAEDVAQKYGGEAKYYKDEHPVHTVELDGFWLGKYEVTNAQMRKFRPNHPSGEFRGHSLNGDNQPAVSVSWRDAKAFCDWLSSCTGKVYCLPSEAQWEYSCRAGTETVRYWGDDDASMGRYANVADRTAKHEFPDWTVAEMMDGYAVSAPVGRFRPNAFGLHDMLGNAWEWCADASGPYDRKRVRNPTGARESKWRVLRGGAWGYYPSLVRCANRDWDYPSVRYILIGFRVCRVTSAR